MNNDLGGLLCAALKMPRPAQSEEARLLLAAGGEGFRVILAHLGACDSQTEQFAIAELLSGFGGALLRDLKGWLGTRSPWVLSTLGVALGWAGLHTAPIIAGARSICSEEKRLLCAWGIGGVMCAATRYRETDALHILREQMAANARQGILFHSTAELEMNITWSRAALWVFRNRERFAVGTKTPRGIIGETGLPYDVQVRPVDDWRRASLIQTWLIDLDVMDREELGVLADQWKAHPDPTSIALHWGRGALWALRELSREEVQSAG